MPYAIENKDILSRATEIALKRYDYTPNKSYRTSRIIRIPVAIVLFISLIGSMPLLVVPYLSDRSAYASAVIDLQKPTNVSNNPSHSKYQNLLVVNEHVYVVWMDGDDTIPKFNIYFKASHDHGKTFSPAIKLSDGGQNLPPIIAAFGNDVYVTWLHEGNGDFGAKFRASHDNGNSFDPRLDFGSDTWYARVDIAAYDNNVYLVFEHPATPGNEAIFQASHDRGVTFGEPFVFRSGPCAGGDPHIAAWKNNIYITAQDPCEGHPDLLFRVSHDSGSTFSDAMYLGDGSQQVKIVTKGKYVYLAWNQNADDVNFRVSSDYGNTFAPTRNMEGNDLNVANPIPQIAISGKNDVYVLWQSNIFPIFSNSSSSNDVNGADPIKTHLFIRASYNNGQDFGSIVRLDSDQDYSYNTQLAASGNDVFVIWQNVSAFWTPSGSEILFKMSNDKGATFGDTVVIDNDTGDSLGSVRPDVDVRTNWLYVSWWHSNELDGSPDVYMQRGKIHGH